MEVKDLKMDNFLWVEEFRPKKVADCILLEPTKEVFQGFVTDGKIPNSSANELVFVAAFRDMAPLAIDPWIETVAGFSSSKFPLTTTFSSCKYGPFPLTESVGG